jgi:hypothetical protein
MEGSWAPNNCAIYRLMSILCIGTARPRDPRLVLIVLSGKQLKPPQTRYDLPPVLAISSSAHPRFLMACSAAISATAKRAIAIPLCVKNNLPDGCGANEHALTLEIWTMKKRVGPYKTQRVYTLATILGGMVLSNVRALSRGSDRPEHCRTGLHGRRGSASQSSKQIFLSK